jgi:hypothetical protein
VGEEHPAFKVWHGLAESKNEQIEQIRRSVNSLLLVGSDILDNGIEQPIIKSLCAGLDKRFLFDPGVNIEPQTLASFVGLISQYVLSPWQPDQILIKGKSLNSQQLATALAQKIERVFQEKIEIKTVNAGNLSAEPHFSKTIINQNSGVEEWLIELVKRLSLPPLSHENKSTLPKTELAEPKLGPVLFSPTTPKLAGSSISNVPQQSREVTTSATKLPEPLVKEEKIDEAVFNLFAQKQVERKEDQIKEIVTKKKKFVKKTHKRSLAFWISLVLSGTGMGIVFLTAVYLMTVLLLQQQTIKLMGAINSPKTSSTRLANTLSTFLKAQTDTYRFLPTEWFIYPNNLWEISNNFLLFHTNQRRVEDLISQSLRSFFGQDNGDVFLSAQAASKQANDSYKQLSLLQAALKNFDDSKLSNQDKQKLQTMTQQLDKERKNLITLQQTQSLLPTILASQGRKTYAILIQDSQELRATGGFINVVAIVTIDHGVLVDKQVFSSYELDQKIYGKVQPPNEITQYLNEKQFYLRDANWDPDFYSSATTISWFIEKSLNRKMDGVIALDSYAIKDLIKAIGPIDLPQYNEVITDKNFFERSEFHSEVLLADGATKPEYLSVFTSALLENITKISAEKTPGFLNALEDTVDSKHLLVAFMEPGIQDSFRALGWTGEIMTPNCPAEIQSDKCVVDAIAQMETNIGVNKANFSLTRTINQTVNVTKEGLVNNRRVVLRNDANSNAWPEGDYKALFRFYLDPAATNEVLTIDNEKVPVSLKMDHGKKVVTFVANVPIQKEVTIDLTYFIPQEFGDKKFGLVFFDQKQPGTDEDVEKITVKYDPLFSPTIIAPQADVNSGQIVFNVTKKAHVFVGVVFEKF